MFRWHCFTGGSLLVLGLPLLAAATPSCPAVAFDPQKGVVAIETTFGGRSYEWSYASTEGSAIEAGFFVTEEGNAERFARATIRLNPNTRSFQAAYPPPVPSIPQIDPSNSPSIVEPLPTDAGAFAYYGNYRTDSQLFSYVAATGIGEDSFVLELSLDLNDGRVVSVSPTCLPPPSAPDFRSWAEERLAGLGVTADSLEPVYSDITTTCLGTVVDQPISSTASSVELDPPLCIDLVEIADYYGVIYAFELQRNVTAKQLERALAKATATLRRGVRQRRALREISESLLKIAERGTFVSDVDSDMLKRLARRARRNSRPGTGRTSIRLTLRQVIEELQRLTP